MFTRPVHQGPRTDLALLVYRVRPLLPPPRPHPHLPLPSPTASSRPLLVPHPSSPLLPSCPSRVGPAHASAVRVSGRSGSRSPGRARIVVIDPIYWTRGRAGAVLLKRVRPPRRRPPGSQYSDSDESWMIVVSINVKKVKKRGLIFVIDF